MAEGAEAEAHPEVEALFRVDDDDDRLPSLVSEASEKRGTSLAFARDFTPRASDPVPVPSSLDPQPLRSTGSPTSIVSHLEISQSLTAAFRTHSLRYGGAEAGKLCGGCGGSGGDDDNVRDAVERNREGSPPEGEERDESGDVEASRPSDPSVSGVSPERSAADRPQTLRVGHVASTERPAASSSSPTPTVPPPGDADEEFFTFVVLHAGEDEAVAARVKAQLESMGVSPGATYSEDFLVPGRGQLNCFEDALDNSAFTLLLLTENYNSRLCAYQTNAALMDSFKRFCKSNTVIPFIPKERPDGARGMPLLLASLVPMDENSRVFASRVKRTFREKDIQEKAAAWRDRRRVQERERLQERERQRLLRQRLLRQLSELGVDDVPPCATPRPCFDPGMPHGAPGPDPPSLYPSFVLSQGFGGARPPLIIQNAQMVQIGDYNRMQVERSNVALGTAEENSGIARD